MQLQIFLAVLLLIDCITEISSSHTIAIYTISTTYSDSTITGAFAQSIIPAQRIAIAEINARSDILPGYTLKLIETEDCGKDQFQAVENAVFIAGKRCDCDTNENQTIVTSPIILGAPWSEFCIATAPVFAGLKYIQISSCASSTELSGVPSFFRTIPNTEITAKAYIPLCKKLGFNRIGIVYINDAAGRNAKDQIEKQALEANIKVESYPFSLGDSMEKTANFIKEMKLYTTIIIPRSGHLESMLNEFKFYGILEYPYYYMFRTEIMNLTQGFITTMQVIPAQLSKEKYIEFNMYNGNETIYNISNNIYSKLETSWKELYDMNASIVYGEPAPHDYSVWGYDSAYAMAYTLDYIIKQGFDLFDDNLNRTLLVETMKHYLTNSLHFIGASGVVDLDGNGDRMYGNYMYGYINNIGEYVPRGVYGGNDIITIDGNIPLPPYFLDRTAPRSIAKIVITTVTADESLYWTIIVLCILFIICTIICIILIWRQRENEIIKKSSYRLNLIICIGAILGFFFITLQRSGDYGCIIGSYGWGIVITLIFMPAFARLYRLHFIMKKRNIDYIMIEKFGRKLFMGIGLMIILDVFLFFALSLSHAVGGNIKSLDFVKDEAVESPNDALIITQNEYEICTTDRLKVATIFAVIIIIYKLIQFIFGLYFSMSTFRWKYRTHH
eukprot:411603_1